MCKYFDLVKNQDLPLTVFFFLFGMDCFMIKFFKMDMPRLTNKRTYILERIVQFFVHSNVVTYAKYVKNMS